MKRRNVTLELFTGRTPMGSRAKSDLLSGRWRIVKLSAAATVIGAASLTSCLFSASPASADQSTAVVTPLLTLFQFGDTVGIPEVCNTSLSALEAGGSQANASEQLSPLLLQIGQDCQNASDQGAGLIQEGITASQSAGALNSLLNPGIAGASNAVATVGNSQGVSSSPFGPTIQGLGQSITFFEGQ